LLVLVFTLTAGRLRLLALGCFLLFFGLFRRFLRGFPGLVAFFKVSQASLDSLLGYSWLVGLSSLWFSWLSQGLSLPVGSWWEHHFMAFLIDSVSMITTV
jgi:hypothetical protein